LLLPSRRLPYELPQCTVVLALAEVRGVTVLTLGLWVLHDL